MIDYTRLQKIINLDWEFILDGVLGSLFYAVVIYFLLAGLSYIHIRKPLQLLYRNTNMDGWALMFMRLWLPFMLLYFFPLVTGTWLVIFFLVPLFRRKPKSKARENLENFIFNTSNGKLSIDNPFRGSLIIGGAGSGKSKSLIEPIIEQASRKGFSGLLYDFKFPILSEEANGYFYNAEDTRLFFVNFDDLRRSHRINPLQPDLMVNSSYAREYAQTILTNLNPESAKRKDFWISSSEALLTGVIWYLKREYPEYCTLPHVIAMLMTDDPEALVYKIAQNNEVKGFVVSVMGAIKAQAGNQLAGVLSTLQNSLSALNMPEIFWVLSGNDLSLDLNNPGAKKFLCIGNNPALSQTYSPAIALIVSASLKQMNQQGKAKSVVILDEAPTLFIPNFSQIPATARSNKVATFYCAQDISQMVESYGETQAESIISNLGNQFYGRTTNPKTAKRVSELFGKEDVEYTSRSVNRGKQTTHGQSFSYQLRDRLKPQEMMGLSTGSFVGIIAEGNQNEFYNQFEEIPSRAKAIMPFKNVDLSEVSKNFNRITEQANSLLKK